MSSDDNTSDDINDINDKQIKYDVPDEIKAKINEYIGVMTPIDNMGHTIMQLAYPDDGWMMLYNELPIKENINIKKCGWGLKCTFRDNCKYTHTD